MSSGISVPVGMKNPTAGSTTVMLNSIYAAQTFQVFVVVVGVGAPIETDVATHNGVRERIAVALALPVAEDEALVRLGGVNGCLLYTSSTGRT